MAGSSLSRAALDAGAIQTGLSGLDGWSYDDNRLEKTFQFGSFREAVSFMVRVAFEAEDLDHHPELSNVYSTVGIGLTTHDAGDRVSEMDFELARRIDHLSWV